MTARRPGRTDAGSCGTGGGTGIGYAIAAGFAAAGDRVTITGRRADVLGEAVARLAARPVVFDAADPAAVAAALPELPARVDVLVNSAGGNTDLVGEPPEPGDLAGLAAWVAEASRPGPYGRPAGTPGGLLTGWGRSCWSGTGRPSGARPGATPPTPIRT
ncbi:MAG: SDR family NAD(P)-dependent oxidoreductase [Micromonosporaceae bacterium]|nr:SDR family NAD(P)-dependent oxidoreductase [Micromonosporaceae bacterium]